MVQTTQINECSHETTATYIAGKNSSIRCCLECGYTEFSIGGVVVRRYFAAPIVFGFVRTIFGAVEKHLKNQMGLPDSLDS